jgi:hypothetical protein
LRFHFKPESAMFHDPAALGDIAVGLTACVAVIALIWSTSTSIPIVWSVRCPEVCDAGKR